MRTIALSLLACLSLIVLPAAAHDYEVGDLHVDHPWARAMPDGTSVGGGYLVIRNEGSEADRLVSVSSPRTPRVEIHEMTMDNDVMRMRELADGLEIPAGETVELKPGGYHVMFMEVPERFAEGERVPATLVFENAGEVEVEFAVEAAGSGEASHGHDHGHGHDDGHHEH